jgi:hypothetical protein
MAAPTNTFLTGAAIGNREDLSDIIYRIDPVDTPVMSSIATEKATAVNHEWQTQALAAASGSNAQAEGNDFAGVAVTPTVRLGNVAQISAKYVVVSGTQQAVKHAGRASEIAYQEMLKGMELKRDMETVLVGTNQAKASTDPRNLASMLSWIKSNTSKGASGADPSAADGTGTRTDGTQRAFTEANLKTVLNSIWTNGGKPNMIVTGAFNKQVFSTFTGRSTPMEEAKSKTIVASVDAYESDFGKLKVVPDRFSRARDVLVLETAKWAVAFLGGRKFISIPIAPTGDSIKREILSEYTLVARNEKSSGGVFDNTTS